MSASAIFVMDMKGKIIISRNYRGDVPMSAAEKFSRHLNEDEDHQLSPIITDEGISYAWIKHNNLILMATTKRNMNCMVILNFLYRIVDIFAEYFNELNEESIRDNFVITYELLDEMMDFGYPQISEAKILKEYIYVQDRHRFMSKKKTQTAPTTITNRVSWRLDGIKHKKNEIFLDVVERLNLLVSANGTVLKSEVLGALKMKSFLSGMPELKLGLNDRMLMERGSRSNGSKGKSIEMEDIRFHQCVRLSRFEHDRTISFIPPDGEFDLMTYRLGTQIRPLIWVEAQVEKHANSRVEYTIKARANFKRRSTANGVEIIIPVPSDADSPSFKMGIGKVEYVPHQDVIIWKIKQFQGRKDYLMLAHFGLPSIEAEEDHSIKKPIQVKFEIPYFTVSGIQVRYLKIIEKSGYTALPWVRYITQNGDYYIRM